MGDLFRRLLDSRRCTAGRSRNRTARPCGAQIMGEKLVGFPRQSEGRIGRDRRILARTARRVPVVSAETRSAGPALSLPRLEIRNVNGQCVDPAFGARGIWHCARGSRLKSYPAIRAGGDVVWIYMGAARAEARARPELEVGEPCRPSGASCPSACRNRTTSQAVEVRDRFQATWSFLHSGELRNRSAVQGQQGQTSTNLEDRIAGSSRVVDFEGGLPHRGAAQGGTTENTTGRITPVGHAVVHDHSRPRGGGHPPRGARLGADRRRALLGVEHQLSPEPARSAASEAEGDERRRGDPREIRARHLRSAREQRRTTISSTAARQKARPLP